MSWSGLDQREFPRISVRCDITISDKRGDTLKTKTQNLGLGGACVILVRELEKLSQVHLRLALEDPANIVSCDGRIVWVIKSKEPSTGKVTFDTGIEFLNLDPQGRDRIKSFLDRVRA